MAKSKRPSKRNAAGVVGVEQPSGEGHPEMRTLPFTGIYASGKNGSFLQLKYSYNHLYGVSAEVDALQKEFSSPKTWAGLKHLAATYAQTLVDGGNGANDENRPEVRDAEQMAECMLAIEHCMKRFIEIKTPADGKLKISPVDVAGQMGAAACCGFKAGAAFQRMLLREAERDAKGAKKTQKARQDGGTKTRAKFAAETAKLQQRLDEIRQTVKTHSDALRVLANEECNRTPGVKGDETHIVAKDKKFEALRKRLKNKPSRK